MANSRVTAYIRGKAHYAKLLGEPRLNYSKDGKEWSLEFEIDDAGEKQLKELGIGSRVKNRKDFLGGRSYITLRVAELRKDGARNDPPKVVDIRGQPWDQRKLIGNETAGDIRVDVIDYGAGKQKGVYLRSLRILDLVPYERSEFPDIDEGDEFFERAKASEIEGDFMVETGREVAEGTPFEVDDLDDEIAL